MDKQRAKEIASSAVMANVMYQGTQVYIQHVDEQTETARIYPVNNPQQEQNVPLQGLTEQ
ncbi:small acid-soluble spore protein H [Ectobacillus sp. JY-23]|uniref:small acid-soluble spore protein H n=1 Tax=Ectobacillus sp. JY-23 TaxID=2933872 RepID=UPI001FF298C6|nr:small acid-soluble spore protein H [Ectobacillus sp. JY-23]UOY92491.1 small acid-soluble spore protein H [Ectobacillus sp. JY-23]